MAIGSLVVELSANVAKFQSDFNRASQIAQDKLKEIDKAAGIVKTTLSSIGVGLAGLASIEAFKGKIEGVIESAAGLQELAERTGATVEGLSALSATAKLSNTDNETLATGLQKLSKAMVDAQNGGKNTSAAFAAIGISTKNIANQKPDELFLQIAKSLDNYNDGAQKVAVATALFGKAGANLLPALKDLAVVGELQARTTKEQSEAADDYQKNLKRLEASTNSIYKKIGGELIPIFDSFTTSLLEAQNANDGIKRSINGLAEDGSIRDFAESVAIAFGNVIEVGVGIIKTVRAIGGSFESVGADLAVFGQTLKTSFYLGQNDQQNAELGALLERRNKIAKEANDRYIALFKYNGTAFTDSLRASFARNAIDRATADQLAKEGGGGLESFLPGGEKKRNINFNPNADAAAINAADTARARLDSQLKPLEAFIAQEKKLLDQRNKDLDELYKLDQISIVDYFSQKQADEQTYLAKVTADYQQEIAVLEKYAKNAKDARTRIETETKIADLRSKASEAADDSARRSAELIRQQAVETEKYRNEVEKLNEQLLRLQGNTAKATELSFDQANAALKRRATVEGDQGTLDKLASVRALTVAQAQLNELDQQASLIQNQLGAAEQRINLEQQLGITDQFQGAIKLGDKRREAIDQLAQIADKMDAVAAASGDPKLIQNAEAFRLKLDELKATADVLAQKLESLFEGTFSNALTDFITGTKSAGQAFKGFVADLNKEIANLVSQQLSKQLFQSIFGGGNSAGLFGGGGGGGGGGFNLGSLASLFSSSGGGDANGAAADALVNSTTALLGFAGGGRPPLGRASIVGENGPELFVPDTAGLIVPGGKIGASGGQNVTVNQQFTVMAPEGRLSRQSDTQLRTLAASSLRAALARNG